MATSKKPTGLQIDRKGNKYIFSWQKPESYGDGQQLVWIYKATKTHKSDVIKLGKSAKNYTVTSPSKLKEISFKVRGNHDQKTKDPGWSDWASKSFDVYPPKKPTVNAAWAAATPDKTTFTYEAKDDEHHPFDHVEYRAKWIKDFNGKPASYSWTGAVSTSSTKTGTIFNSTETIPAGQSYTRVVQCRTVGPGGVVKDPWVFKWHTYAKPNVPQIVSTKGTVQDTTRGKITLNLSWKTSAPSSRPIDKIVIEYLITAPGADMSVPAGTKFQEADTPAKKGANSWAEEIDSTLADDQVLFARIHVYHDTREDWSDPVIALKGRLAAPTGVSITPTQSTHTITVNATNASSVPDSYLAVVYRLRPQFEATFAIIPHGSSTVNMVVPEWTGDFAGAVAVYAVVGSYTVSPVSSEGTRIYTIAEPQMTSDRVWKGVLSAPTINVVQSDIESTAIVTWEWTSTSVTEAEVSWSDHEDAWDSTDEPETYIVSNSKASRLSVSGLETGIDLYFRVRLMQTVGDDTSYGLYSDTFVINLASAPAIPVLEMSSQVIDPAGEAIASWVYISRDNSMQAHATIVEVDTSTTPWTYTPILQVNEEQQAVIRPSDLEWAVGDYLLAVQVQSGSGRFSELSDPVPVTVREPLTCSISDPSLVYDSIPVNPESYTGNPITFDSEDQEKEVLSLDVSLLPVQDGTPSQDSTVYNEPYLSKTSPSFNSEYDKLVGGTVAWNQLVQNGNFASKSVWSEVNATYSVSNNVATVTYTSVHYSCISQVIRPNANHKYLLYANAKSSDIPNVMFYWGGNIGGYTIANNWTTIATVYNASGTEQNFSIRKYNNTSLTGDIQQKNFMVIDLTALFNPTIADYIYNLEQSQAGAGVAWFRRYFPEDYYPYHAVSLESVQATAHKTYDGDGNVIGNYALDSSLTLRGIPKLVDGKLAFDGDVYPPSGEVQRRYGVVDLGTLNWSRSGDSPTDGNLFVTSNLLSSNGNTNYICAKYTNLYITSPRNIPNNSCGNSIANKSLYIRDDAYSDAASFKAAMSGVMLVYELATPTTETAEPFTNPQAVGSTESYTDNRAVPIPVGHESTYANIYPITGYDNTIFTDSNGTDTTTTTVTLPHTVYGADVDVIGGASKETWQNIASYNGETISEPWLSSMDEYVQGTTPTTGAQVTYKLATPTDLQTTPTDVELLTGVNNISADGDMELTIADMIESGYFLKGMPMTATVTGAGETGQTILMIKRKADYVIMKPDETELVGHADEVICQHVYTGEAQQTISIDEVQGKLNDGATYYIEATVTDDLGRQASDRYPNDDPDDYFKVIWDEQAIMPEATAEIINNDYAKLTITKPQVWADGDVVDIYRMTSDKPQKIAEDVEMDDDPVEYVDPFPTLGENGGYRFVYKTVNGDDTLDADDNFAWLDVKAVCDSTEALIDFNGERIPLPYNLKVSNTWGKDFQETRYLGGHIAGDWTAGVSRSGSIDSVTVPVNEPAVFRSIRRLAEYTELCHVRTLDGSVMTCNVDVDDDFGYDTAGKIQSVKLDFTRVDPVDLDAVPLADWLVTP